MAAQACFAFAVGAMFLAPPPNDPWSIGLGGLMSCDNLERAAFTDSKPIAAKVNTDSHLSSCLPNTCDRRYCTNDGRQNLGR